MTPNLFSRLDAREAGHVDVHEHHVGAHLTHQRHGLHAVCRFPNDAKLGVVFQQRPNAFPHQWSSTMTTRIGFVADPPTGVLVGANSTTPPSTPSMED